MKINRLDVAPKKEETANNAGPPTDTSAVQPAAKPAANTQQQQVAIPKRKRRDRIPERPNYRFVSKHVNYPLIYPKYLVSIYGVL